MNCSLGIGNPDTVLPSREVANMFLFFAALTREDCCQNSVDFHFGPAFEQDNPDGYTAFYNLVFANCDGIPLQIPILVSRETFLGEYREGRFPVMVVLSKSDVVTPLANSDAFAKHIPDAKIEFLDGYHASMLIHPRKVTALLRDFLSSYCDQLRG